MKPLTLLCLSLSLASCVVEQPKDNARAICLAPSGDTLLDIVTTRISAGSGGFFGNGRPGLLSMVDTSGVEHAITVGGRNGALCVMRAVEKPVK